MAEARKPTQRYLSGRVKIAGTEALATDRHLYVDPGQVEPNLGYVGEKNIPIADKYYQLVTIDNGTTYDRYWQETSGLIPGGITVFDEGTQVGAANSITKLDFVGIAVTATASGSISTITITNNAQVAVGTEPPSGALNGDLWWDSEVGELFVYYDDEIGTPSAQWVETSGGSETVTISDDPPPSANSGDLWWESDTEQLRIYYDDGVNPPEWVFANQGVSQFWIKNDTGIHTVGNVGVGTTNAVGIASTTNTSILNAGIVTAVKYYGDGSNLTGINLGGAGGKWVQTDAGIHTLSAVGVGTTNPLSPVHPDNNTILHAGIVTANEYYGDGSTLTGVGGTVGIGTTAPVDPDAGDLWWNNSDGKLAIYYNDHDGSPSAQWVQVSEGPMGRQGVQGAPGVQGAQGEQGSPGSDSSVAGPQGVQGAQGRQGAPGPQGVQGTPGAQGEQGAPGTGAQGVQGAPGVQGAQGVQGSQGVQGNSRFTGCSGCSRSSGCSGYCWNWQSGYSRCSRCSGC